MCVSVYKHVYIYIYICIYIYTYNMLQQALCACDLVTRSLNPLPSPALTLSRKLGGQSEFRILPKQKSICLHSEVQINCPAKSLLVGARYMTACMHVYIYIYSHACMISIYTYILLYIYITRLRYIAKFRMAV